MVKQKSTFWRRTSIERKCCGDLRGVHLAPIVLLIVMGWISPLSSNRNAVQLLIRELLPPEDRPTRCYNGYSVSVRWCIPVKNCRSSDRNTTQGANFIILFFMSACQPKVIHTYKFFKICLYLFSVSSAFW